jgi:hypothetical protein
MILINEPEGTTSEILKRWADGVYTIVALQETLQSVFLDVESKELYSIPDDVDYWLAYIWRYNNSILTWKKIYE